MSNWTYNSYYTFGNNTYYGNSLGYPKNGLKKIDLSHDSFIKGSIQVTAEIFYEEEKLQDLEMHFIDIKSKHPIGVVQKRGGINIDLSYTFSNLCNVSSHIDYSAFDNYENILDNNKGGFFIYGVYPFTK